MPQDHEGNEITVGYIGYLPFTVTAINNGALKITTAYSGVVINNVPSPDIHQGGKPTWPNLP